MASQAPAADEHPYSPATVAAGLIFSSGALSVDRDYRPVPGRREALDAALENVYARLASAGGDPAGIVRLTYYVTDLTLRDEANEQFINCFVPPRPARSFVEVRALPYGATVEIEAIARVKAP